MLGLPNTGGCDPLGFSDDIIYLRSVSCITRRGNMLTAFRAGFPITDKIEKHSSIGLYATGVLVSIEACCRQPHGLE